MAFVRYQYKFRAKEIKAALRRREILKGRERYHATKQSEIRAELDRMELEISRLQSEQ